MKSENKKCADTIKADLESRIEQLAEFQDMIDDEEKETQDEGYEKEEQFNQDILSVDSEVVHKVLLSWGGPSDYFEVRTKEGEVTQIQYCTRDWFDGAEINVDAGSDAWDRVERAFGWMLEGKEV